MLTVNEYGYMREDQKQQKPGDTVGVGVPSFFGFVYRMKWCARKSGEQ